MLTETDPIALLPLGMLGRLLTATVPLTGWVAGKLSTSTCRLAPLDCVTVTLPLTVEVPDVTQGLVPCSAVTVPLTGCVAGKLETETDPIALDPAGILGRLDTATVPLTACVAGKLSTSTCKLDPVA